jgi:hypothetical protein
VHDIAHVNLIDSGHIFERVDLDVHLHGNVDVVVDGSCLITS